MTTDIQAQLRDAWNRAAAFDPPTIPPGRRNVGSISTRANGSTSRQRVGRVGFAQPAGAAADSLATDRRMTKGNASDLTIQARHVKIPTCWQDERHMTR